jgi:hypothetical protein
MAIRWVLYGVEIRLGKMTPLGTGSLTFPYPLVGEGWEGGS